MTELARRINKDNLSIWMFPEGTRSRGRGLLPFKTGAFHAAIAAGVPIVPVVCSTTHNKIDLNRWDNGKVICEMMDPIDISSYTKRQCSRTCCYCHDLMENASLNSMLKLHKENNMLRLSRRQLLKTTAISTALAATPQSVLAASREKLTIPPLMETKRGRPIILNMEETGYKLDGSHSVSVWGFNGNYLGPTIRIQIGFLCKTQLSQQFATKHCSLYSRIASQWRIIWWCCKSPKKGESWAPIIPIDQPAATCWYRSATLANSAYQTYRGIVGMWLIEDDQSFKIANCLINMAWMIFH